MTLEDRKNEIKEELVGTKDMLAHMRDKMTEMYESSLACDLKDNTGLVKLMIDAFKNHLLTFQIACEKQGKLERMVEELEEH